MTRVPARPRWRPAWSRTNLRFGHLGNAGLIIFCLALVLAGALDVVTLALSLPPSSLGGVDLRNWYAAATLLSQGRNPYSTAAIIHEVARLAPGLHPSATGPIFPYLPWYTIAMWPITLVPFVVAYVGWVLGNAVLVGWCSWLWLRWSGFQGRVGMVVLLVLMAAPFAEITQFGESSALVLGGITGTFALYRHRQWFWLGVLAALLVALKPQDAIWVPVGTALLTGSTRRGLRAYLVGLGAGVLVVVGLPLLVRPTLWPLWWHHFWQFVGTIARTQQDVASLAGVERWVTAYGSTTGVVHDPVFWFLAMLCLITIGLWLARVRHSQSWRGADKLDAWIAWVAVPNILIMAFSPYFHTYDLITWLPLLIWGISRHPASLRWLGTWIVCAGLEITRVSQYLIPVPPLVAGSTTPAVVAGVLVLGASWLGAAESRLRAQALPARTEPMMGAQTAALPVLPALEPRLGGSSATIDGVQVGRLRHFRDRPQLPSPSIRHRSGQTESHDSPAPTPADPG